MNNILSQTIISVVLVGFGIGAGYLAKTDAVKAGASDTKPDAKVTFDKRTLQNLGVEIAEATLSTFVEHRIVHAVIRAAPLNDRPVAAPLAGVVQSIAVEPGTVLKSGAEVMTVMRDAIARPQLELTGDVFAPVSETLHSTFSELRTAANELSSAEKELSRVERINAASIGAPVVSKQIEIDLGYRVDAARTRIANARSELGHHGLSDTEIDAVIRGAHPPRGPELWQRLLTVHGLWTADVQELSAALPATTRNLPWSIATLGELSAAGVVNASLVEAVKDSAAIRENFAAVAGLLQRGQTVARLRWLADQGALESVFQIRAPADGPPDWDVVDVKVQPGQSVVAGQTVAILRDARTMWLRLQPVGDEVSLVLAALRDGTRLSAKSLVAGAGPDLDGLKIFQITSNRAATGDVASLRCQNTRAAGADAGSRSWQLRTGLRYKVAIPGIVHEKVFVFPKDGVAKEGSSRVVFVEDGKTFGSRTVRVLYEDDDHVVVAADGAIFPGDGVVIRGAFVIGIALQQGQGGGGHGHPH